MAWNDGRLEAVINAKVLPPERRPGLVEDVERGFREGIEPLPWQTDTCIGDWHYNRGVFEGHHYKPASSVIHRLCDIVSKNGNLLLSVPVRGDGTIDADERKIVEDIGVWMARNGEAIHGTRPWRVYGEGPTRVSGGMFSEGNSQPMTPDDIRFTTQGGALYAIALGWPRDGVMRIQTLAEESAVAPGAIDSIVAVGSGDSLSFKRTRRALEIRLPEGLAGSPAVAVKIRGAGVA
jgi:alpha-L-fucosidase